MAIFRVYTILLCLLFTLNVSAQKSPMKWGKVSEADLAMTEYDLDAEADAVVLGDYGTITFLYDSDSGLDFEFSTHKRIKILKESAFDQGDISIGYNGKSGKEKIRKLKAQVIFPDGRKEALKKSDFFEEKVSDTWRRKKFAFPNLKPGCIIEYKYTKKSEYILTLEDWYFQESIPVRFSELRLEVPSVYQYIYLVESRSQKIDRTEKKNIQGGGGATNFTANRVTFRADNVPAMKEESYITTMDDYRAGVRFQLKAVTGASGKKQILSNWKEVAERLEVETDFGRQYRNSLTYNKIGKAAAPYIDDTGSTLDKIKQAQKFITSNITWNDRYGMYPNESLKKLMNQKIANGAGMNMLLLAVLKSQGIEAYPALTSTRGHGKTIQLYPIVEQFNHLMVYVKVDGKPMILDALDAFHPVGYPHSNALNHYAWVVNKKAPEWVEVKTKSSAKSYLTTLELDAEGNLKGTINSGCNGYHAIYDRRRFSDSKYGGWKKTLEGIYPEAKIDSIEVINEDDINQSLKVNLDCTISKAATVNGDFIYLNPVITPAYDENPFKLEKRNYPVDQVHQWKENYILNLTIPEGYELEELPEPVLLALPNKGGRFSHQLKKVDETHIQLVSKVSIKQTYFRPEEYVGLKKFIDMVIEKQGEQIVLKKKS